MTFRILAIALAASSLAAGVHAQQTRDKHVDMPIGAQTGKALETALAPETAPTGAPTNVVSVESLSEFNAPGTPYISDSVSGPASDPTLVISSSPVPDTAENRTKYKPLSATGRRNPTAGN